MQGMACSETSSTQCIVSKASGYKRVWLMTQSKRFWAYQKNRDDHLLRQVCPTHPRGCISNRLSIQSYIQFFQVVWICFQIEARPAYGKQESTTIHFTGIWQAAHTWSPCSQQTQLSTSIKSRENWIKSNISADWWLQSCSNLINILFALRNSRRVDNLESADRTFG